MRVKKLKWSTFMNSLSEFAHSKFPLRDFLASVSLSNIPSDILVCKHKNFYRVILPSRKCFVDVAKNSVTVERTTEKFAFGSERKSVYSIESVDQARVLIGILGGVCYEHGCSTYGLADATVNMIYYFLNRITYGVV